MVLEEQILRFYLKVSSFFFILFLFYIIFIIFIKDVSIKKNFILIDIKESHTNIIDKNIDDNKLNLYIYKSFIKISLFFNSKIHHGKFKITDDDNFINFYNLISKPSNYLEKITIVEGWSKKKLNKLLYKYFQDYEEFQYNELIADTYYFHDGVNFNVFKNQIDRIFVNMIKKYEDHILLKKFTFEEILIIGSLLEKEGINYEDKKEIFSVIINRLDIGMKLQIDATVIYSITRGNKELNRKLSFKDLKIKDDFNTYYIYGLPPTPISYVGAKTIDLIFENHKSNYLFYFYNILEKKHIFSTNYDNHLYKLNEYRKKI